MSLFSRLFGAPKTPEELLQEARSALQEAHTAKRDKHARRILMRNFDHGPLEPLVDFEGPLHDVFLKHVLERSHDVDKAPTSPEALPTLKVYTDPSPDEWDNLLMEAVHGDHNLVLIRETAPVDGHLLILCAVEVWAMFAREPHLAAAYLGEGYLMIRRGLLEYLVKTYPEWAEDELSCDVTASLLEDFPEFSDATHRPTPFNYEVYCFHATH